MENRILALLSENARMSLAEMAARLETTPEAVREAIQSLEKRGVIRGYKVILNESELDSDKVKALIEVKVTPKREGGFDQVAQRIARYPEVTDLYLVSGSFRSVADRGGKVFAGSGDVRIGQALDHRGSAFHLHRFSVEEVQGIRQDHAE